MVSFLDLCDNAFKVFFFSSRINCDDHIVPHWSGEPGLFASYDAHGKSPQDTLINDVGRNMHSMDVTELVLLGKEETGFFFWND